MKELLINIEKLKIRGWIKLKNKVIKWTEILLLISSCNRTNIGKKRVLQAFLMILKLIMIDLGLIFGSIVWGGINLKKSREMTGKRDKEIWILNDQIRMIWGLFAICLALLAVHRWEADRINFRSLLGPWCPILSINCTKNTHKVSFFI